MNDITLDEHKRKINRLENELFKLFIGHDCSFAEAQEAMANVNESLKKTVQRMIQDTYKLEAQNNNETMNERKQPTLTEIDNTAHKFADLFVADNREDHDTVMKLFIKAITHAAFQCGVAWYQAGCPDNIKTLISKMDDEIKNMLSENNNETPKGN